MDSAGNIRTISVLLTFVAGFCDTATFIAADEVFSAHVTGNFIVLAYDIAHYSDTQAWVKLLTFPVFVAAVMMGGWLTRKSSNKYWLLLAEGVLLFISGALAFAFIRTDVPLPWLTHLVTMLVVFAMGFQNTFGRLHAKETYGPTTVMTGNVTQAALDLADTLVTKVRDAAKWESLKKQVVIIAGFLLGCLLGAFIAKPIGLGVVLLPGIVLIIAFSHVRSFTKVYQRNS